jgi:pimeloyl-ACP methyl ester carboxylesterase
VPGRATEYSEGSFSVERRPAAVILIDVERGMVIIPGGGLGPHQPLLNYSWLAGRARGAEALHIEWPSERPTSRDPADSASWVVEQVATAMATFGVPGPVLVGKSLATYAAELAADRALPAIWHTPLLSDPRCVAALRGATAPFLLVGGTADHWWDSRLARTLTPHLLEIPGADHGMILPGVPLARSAAVLGQVAACVEEFLDREVWP